MSGSALSFDGKKAICLAIADFFEIGEVISINPVGKGGSHQSFFLTTHRESYVARIMSSFDSAALENELAVQKQAVTAGIVCNTFVSNSSGSYLFSECGVVATLSVRVNGKQPKPTLEECEMIGRALAIFHSTIKTLPNPKKSTLISSERVVSRLERMGERERHVLDWLTSDFLRSKRRYDEMPSGIGHGDLHLANILIHGETVILLDLENVTRGPLVVDVARSLADVCSEVSGFNPEKMQSYLKGYERIRPISRSERLFLEVAIPYAAASVALWFYERANFGMYEYFINVGRSAKLQTLN